MKQIGMEIQLSSHLAHWHLTRLAHAGRGIAYDPAADAAQRAAAIREWRVVIPEGGLPRPARGV